MWRRACKKGLVFRGQQGGGALALPNFGILLYLWLHPLTQNAHVQQGTICGGRACIWSQPRLLFEDSGIPAIPNFGVLLHLCLHSLCRTTKICVVTYVGRASFRRSARPLHLHKCVARFVSDCWVSCTVGWHQKMSSISTTQSVYWCLAAQNRILRSKVTSDKLCCTDTKPSRLTRSLSTQSAHTHVHVGLFKSRLHICSFVGLKLLTVYRGPCPWTCLLKPLELLVNCYAHRIVRVKLL